MAGIQLAKETRKRDAIDVGVAGYENRMLEYIFEETDVGLDAPYAEFSPTPFAYIAVKPARRRNTERVECVDVTIQQRMNYRELRVQRNALKRQLFDFA